MINYDILAGLKVFRLEEEHLTKFQHFESPKKLLDDYLDFCAIQEQKDNPNIQTYLAEYKGIIFGYITIFTTDNLRATYVDTKKRKGKIVFRPSTKAYGALKIARLATNKLYTSRGVGTFLVAFAWGLAKIMNIEIKKSGLQLYQYLTADSYLDCKGFYEKLLFKETKCIDSDPEFPNEDTELMYISLSCPGTRIVDVQKEVAKRISSRRS
jgi:GNAT superfamily N-acetyltransferase